MIRDWSCGNTPSLLRDSQNEVTVRLATRKRGMLRSDAQEPITMKCARRACGSFNAVCRHTQTGRLYCPRCARRINEGYQGATPLVTFPANQEEAKKILAMTGMNKQQQEAELARQYDAKSEPDRLRGQGWCKYQLNGWFIWETPKDGKCVWAMARLTTDTTPAYFTDHWYTEDCSVFSLETVFKRALSS